MPAKSIRTGESPAATPLASNLEITLAYKLLLARVQTLVSLAIVLSGKSFAADGTHKRSLVSVCSQVRAQVIGASESLGAESALERGRMLLNPLGRAAVLVVLVLRVG